MIIMILNFKIKYWKILIIKNNFHQILEFKCLLHLCIIYQTLLISNKHSEITEEYHSVSNKWTLWNLSFFVQSSTEISASLINDLKSIKTYLLLYVVSQIKFKNTFYLVKNNKIFNDRNSFTVGIIFIYSTLSFLLF